MIRLALWLLLLCVGFPVAAAQWGEDYVELPAQPTAAKPGQVEVLEFFWYGCPHCYHLEPELNAWVGKLPKNVVFKRVPAILDDAWMPLARAFFALDTMGLRERLHGAVFRAIHVEHLDLDQPGVFLDWAARQGVDRGKLAAAYDSFLVDTEVMKARQLSSDFRINGVPSFVVAGRYGTSAYLTGGVPQTFEVLDELIAQESGRK